MGKDRRAQTGRAPLKILYVGALTDGSTCRQRMRAMRELGHRVVAVDSGRSPLPGWLAGPLAAADFRLLNWRLDLSGVNRSLKRAVRDHPDADVVWLDKPLAIRRSTLRWMRSRLSAAVLATYSPDDQLNRANHSRSYLRALPEYDVVFTTKSFNVPELEGLGARRVELAGVGYDPSVHRPVSLTSAEREEFGADVSFVGTYEDERWQYLGRLAEETSASLKIWGNGWPALSGPTPLARAVRGRPVYGDDYARVVCASRVNLAFLRKEMRDRITTRSVEIPACGGFMLAESSGEHRVHFEADSEAVFFSTYGEMRQKVHYYLSHPRERRAIAGAGRRRCIRSDYSNHRRMRDCLEKVQALREAQTASPTVLEAVPAGKESPLE
jgi:spore maturation protein CgeB